MFDNKKFAPDFPNPYCYCLSMSLPFSLSIFRVAMEVHFFLYSNSNVLVDFLLFLKPINNHIIPHKRLFLLPLLIWLELLLPHLILSVF